MLTFGAVLKRGATAGAAAGLAAAVVGLLVVEPPIRAALAVEESRATTGGHGHEELFTRPTQVLGGMVAALAVGVCLGAVLAVVYAKLRHRLPGRTDFGRAVLLAAVGFGTVALLPGLKYPANPPGVGDPETVTARTVQYLLLIAAGIVIAYLALLGSETLDRRGWRSPYRNATVTVGVTVALVVLLVATPASPDAVPGDIPAGLLWTFRVASLAELATMWGVLGLGFGLLLTPRPARTPARAGTATGTTA